MTTHRAPYHAHVYCDAGDRGAAQRLHRKLSQAKGTGEFASVIFVRELRDRNVGPHPKPRFEVDFREDALPAVRSVLEASGLTALVHPLTDDHVADHTSLAVWPRHRSST